MMLKRNTFMGRFVRASSPSLGRLRTSVLLLLMLLSLFCLARRSHAQATPTAEKNGGIDVFGAFTLTSPYYPCCNLSDYSPSKDVGVSVGGAYMLKKFLWGQPAVAARYSFVTGSHVNESFFGGGGELRYQFRMLRPYATLLGGVGSLSVPATGYRDSGNALVVGGGTDYPVSPRFAARGEFTYSFVDITGYQNTQVGAKHQNPWSINLGVVYHIK
jgi:hypothetical protein